MSDAISNFGNISSLSQASQDLIMNKVYSDFDQSLLTNQNAITDSSIETICRQTCALMNIANADQKIVTGVKSLLTDLEKLSYTGPPGYVNAPVWMKFRNYVVLYHATIQI